MNHHLLPIGELRPLHPVEVAIVAKLTAHGNHVRQCSCGMLIAAQDEIDVRRRYREHYATARQAL